MITGRKGSILVFILALIVLLSVLCMRLMQETVQELRHVSQFHRRDDLRMHAYSALDVCCRRYSTNLCWWREHYIRSLCKGGGIPLVIRRFLLSILRLNGRSHWWMNRERFQYQQSRKKI